MLYSCIFFIFANEEKIKNRRLNYNSMKKLASLLLCIFLLAVPGSARDFKQLYEQLEQALSQRPDTDRRKEQRIDSIRASIRAGLPADTLFARYHRLYQEYLTYRSDSALYYIARAHDAALRTGKPADLYRCAISRATILATTGYFSQALNQLQKIERSRIDSTLLADYYEAYEWVYSVWSEYTDDDYYTPRYRKLEIAYNDSLLRVLPPGSSKYHYWQGEYKARTGDQSGARKAYERALKGLTVDTRLYACVTCGLAFAHSRQGNLEEFEHYLILAAISDNVCPLKENLALQELALLIYRNRKGGLEQANRYLNYSMEDATFYNNRLRMLEIARKFPAIVNAYQQENIEKSQRLAAATLSISALTLLLLFSLAVIRRQLRRVHGGKRELNQLNHRLSQLNDELLQTNRTREEYVSLFLDLCASYIDKLNRYQELVKRKVKAKQADDLLKQINSKMNEADAKRFFVNFDMAFLTLYPGFVAEFNALLRPGEEILPPKGEQLNTELRIFALIRMGIKDSSRIATLLFYSPQTIYNYRTSVRNRARNRDTFEEQVRQLCPTLQQAETPNFGTITQKEA